LRLPCCDYHAAITIYHAATTRCYYNLPCCDYHAATTMLRLPCCDYPGDSSHYNILQFLPPFYAMTIVTAAAIVGLRKLLVGSTAGRIVVVSCRRSSEPRIRIHVGAAELLAAFPAPGLAAAGSNDKCAVRRKSAGKDIITGGVFQAPTVTPGTLLGVIRHVIPIRIGGLGLAIFYRRKGPTWSSISSDEP